MLLTAQHRHNVGPTKYGAVYRTDVNPHEGGEEVENQEGERADPVVEPRIVQYMKWGLVPSYFKDQSGGGKMFNCRGDSLVEGKPVWSGPKKHNRCLVFVEGYYEWEKEGAKNKIPYYVKRKDGKLMCMAGLWDRNDKGGEELYSFTIITTEAHEGIRWLHDRMPVIVDSDDELINKWLDPNLIWKDNSKDFEKVIKPYDSSKLEVYEVSQEVNKIGGDSEKMNKPVKVSAKKGPASSFFQKKKKEEVKDEVKEEKVEPGEGDVKEEEKVEPVEGEVKKEEKVEPVEGEVKDEAEVQEIAEPKESKEPEDNKETAQQQPDDTKSDDATITEPSEDEIPKATPTKRKPPRQKALKPSKKQKPAPPGGPSSHTRSRTRK